MTTDLATRVPALLPEAVEQALVQGNLAELSPVQRVSLYKEVCSSLGLNPLTVPFQYITLNGKLVLYALKNATDQLRFIHSVNVEIVSRERIDDLYVVTTRATLPNGRTDEEIGAVPIANLKGEALANALMKASTKSKRRVTLAIVGLSMLDETEVDSVRDARHPAFQVSVDRSTGEITEGGGPAVPISERAQSYLDRVDDMLDLDGLRGVWKVAKADEEAGDLTKAERRAINEAITERKAEIDAQQAMEPEPVGIS